MNNPLIYIIVLNYNRKGDTLECLDSLFRMDYPNYKVLVVDNASSDGTADAVRKAYPGAEVLENEKNLMYAGGNNEGIRFALARGAEWVLLLNNDTVVDRRLLPEMLDAADTRPDAGVIGPMIYYYSSRGAAIAEAGLPAHETIWYAGGIVKLWMGLTAHRGIREVDSGRYGRVEETDYVTGCAMLISRACLEKVGLLDTSYGMYAEDADFSLRARRAGFRLVFAPGGKVRHKISMSTGGEFSLLKTRLKIMSNLRLFMRFARPWHWLTMPVFVLGRGINFVAKRYVMKH